jgi:hypothetical protein
LWKVRIRFFHFGELSFIIHDFSDFLKKRMSVLEKVIIDNVLNFVQSDRRAGHESISRVTRAIGLVT